MCIVVVSIPALCSGSPGSNLGQETGYSNWLSWFSTVSQQKMVGHYLILGH